MNQPFLFGFGFSETSSLNINFNADMLFFRECFTNKYRFNCFLSAFLAVVAVFFF